MSKLSEVIKKIKEKDLDFFFGENNYQKTSNKYLTFKRVLNEDEIILLTKNVIIIKDNYVLIVGNNKAVYLKDWAVKQVRNYYENIEAYAVKLNRKYFKIYTFKSDFEDFAFDKDENFDDLFKVAEEQEKENLKIALGW